MTLKPASSPWHTLSNDEADASKTAIDLLRRVSWAAPLIATIDRAGGISPENMALLFEARFALALHDCGIKPDPTYEYSAGVGDSTIDFAFAPWNIELLSLGETDAARSATTQNGPFFGRLLTSPVPPSWDITDQAERKLAVEIMKQSSEGEMLKVIDRVVDKASGGKSRRPHKFALPDGQRISMLVVDIRSYGAGTADETDMRQIAYGPDAVTPEMTLVWTDPNGKRWPIRGVFDPENARPGSQNFRERVHFLGLVTESTYARSELQHAIKFFRNPALLTPDAAKQILGRFPLHNPDLARSSRPEDYLDEHHDVISNEIVRHALVVNEKALVYHVHKDILEDLAGRPIGSNSDLEQAFRRHQHSLERAVRAKYRDVGTQSDGTISIDPRDRKYCEG
jgi:hypothetical protein